MKAIDIIQDVNELIKQLTEEKVEGIITIALPPHILAPLSSAFPLFLLKMENVGNTTSIEEAQTWVAENPAKRTYLPGKPGEKIRLLEFRGITRVKIKIEEELVIAAED